jgi:hypothetical protein
VEIAARGCTHAGGKGVSTIEGTIERGLGNVENVRISGVREDAAEVLAAQVRGSCVDLDQVMPASSATAVTRPLRNDPMSRRCIASGLEGSTSCARTLTARSRPVDNSAAIEHINVGLLLVST